MAYTVHNKPYSSPAQQVGQLQSKGLSVASTIEAERFLSHINLYRFKIYLDPYFNAATSQYTGSFEDGVEFYRFDDELRDFLFSLIGRIEIKLRSKLDHTIAAHASDPFWYLYDQFFNRSINKTRNSLSNSFMRSRDEFVRHFKEKYINDKSDDYKYLPPFWVIGELTTFGNVLEIYKALIKSPFELGGRQNKLDNLAKSFGAKNLKELINWMTLIRDVRNRCAHHSRVWNSNYPAPSSVVTRLSIPPANANRLYTFIAMLHIMNKRLGFDIDPKDKILELFNRYPSVVNLQASAGFPIQWETDLFWQ